MNIIESNIENLTSLWRVVSEPFGSYFNKPDFNYSLIKNSEWPNRLWFNQDINQNTITMIKEKLSSVSTNLIIPYWDIYDSNSFKLLEENGFKLKFEQVGMSLRTNQPFKELEALKLKKVSTKKDAELWSKLFSKAFGYLINPIILIKTHKNINYFIAYHQNHAIGTGILYIANNISGIHSVGIIPEMRRRGFAEQIMKLLINQSIKINSDYITLQSSDMGKNLYLKLGFKEQFKIKSYALQQRT